MVHGAGFLYTTLLSFPICLQGNWSIWFMGSIGLLYTALLQGNWSVWFMGQVCYILRYCLFLYLYRVTGLYGSWGRFAIYYATVQGWSVWFMGHFATLLSFPISFRVTGLYGSWGRFAIYYAAVFSYIFSG